MGGVCRVLRWATPSALSSSRHKRRPDFAREIEPILIKRCFECHGPDMPKAKLRLDSRADVLKPAKSVLVTSKEA